MQDDLKEFIRLIFEKEYEINLSKPEDLEKFDRTWKQMHHKYQDRILKGAKLLLSEEEVE